MSFDALSELNEKQREAVLYFDGPLMIIAGAGSGKTRVITHKIAYLIMEKGLSPGQILGVTFTNKAANEMKERIEELTRTDLRLFNLSTFHSLGLRILRTAGREKGYEGDWQVIDEQDQKRIFTALIKESGATVTNDQRDSLRRKIGMAKMNLLYPNNKEYLLQKGFTIEEYGHFSTYFKWQQSQRRWDYEDLVSLPVKILQSDEALCREYSERFRYVVVDEFQDTNPNQYELIRLLAQRHGNITIVGDDDQAIYGWRGADIRFLMNFEQDFAGTRVIKLEQNYRSSPNVLAFANQVISRNRLRKEKAMWTDKKQGEPVMLLHSGSKEEEASWVADLIETFQKKDQGRLPLAILYRINSQSLAFENELNRRAIPYRVLKGLRFFDRKEIKDSIALLRLANQADDDASFLRVIDFLSLGIGEKSVKLIAELARDHRQSYYWALKNHFPDKWSSKPLWRLIDRGVELFAEGGQADGLEKLLKISGYLDLLSEKGEDDRLLNIQELLGFIRKWEEEKDAEASISDLFDQITLQDPGEKENRSVSVFLLTMHNAKGLEFPTTVVSGVNATYLPFFLRKGHQEIEEERRLFYVSSTRAISLLVLSVGGGKESPFITEMNGSLFSRCFGSEDLLNQLYGNVGSVGRTAGKNEKKVERYLTHPIFGRGKIVEDLGRSRMVVHFVDRGEKVIDASIVPVIYD